MMNYCEHGVHKNSCALCKITNMTSKTYKKIQVEFVGFCSEGKGGKTRLECAKWIADKFSTLLEEKMYDVMGELNDISENIHFSVKVETDNSKAIKVIITKLEHEVANKLLGKAKEKVLSILREDL